MIYEDEYRTIEFEKVIRLEVREDCLMVFISLGAAHKLEGSHAKSFKKKYDKWQNEDLIERLL